MIGYMVENLLGFAFSLTLNLAQRRGRDTQSRKSKFIGRCTNVARRGCSCFYDCAVFFTISIQIACTVVLARLDFGISANGMGDYTARITWAIFLLTILPPMYIAFRPYLLKGSTIKNVVGTESQRVTDRREQLRFLLFGLCWLLSIYPFLSKMMETFGTSVIGGGEQVISDSDWHIIVRTCDAPTGPVVNRETIAISFFSVAGSLLVNVLATSKIIWLAMKRQHGDSALVRRCENFWSRGTKWPSRLSFALLIVVPIIALSQLWSVFKYRILQRQISQASGNQNLDGQWTFGQVVAVTIFTPVLVECWFAWLYE